MAKCEVIVATGPLTSDAMSAAIQRYFGGQEYMSFFDAAAPLVTFSSIDMEKAWFASRYDRGDADYVNCSMDKDEYLAFVEALRTAEEAPVHGFERLQNGLAAADQYGLAAKVLRGLDRTERDLIRGVVAAHGVYEYSHSVPSCPVI